MAAVKHFWPPRNASGPSLRARRFPSSPSRRSAPITVAQESGGHLLASMMVVSRVTGRTARATGPAPVMAMTGHRHFLSRLAMVSTAIKTSVLVLSPKRARDVGRTAPKAFPAVGYCPSSSKAARCGTCGHTFKNRRFPPFFTIWGALDRPGYQGGEGSRQAVRPSALPS
jgi:hypothetical protein